MVTGFIVARSPRDGSAIVTRTVEQALRAVLMAGEETPRVVIGASTAVPTIRTVECMLRIDEEATITTAGNVRYTIHPAWIMEGTT